MMWILVGLWLATTVSITHCAVQGPTVQSLHITSVIRNHFAVTVVTSRVTNPTNLPGEASFIVTLPESAYIKNFTMSEKGNTYVAGMRKKNTRYNQAVQAGTSVGRGYIDPRDSTQFVVSVSTQPGGDITYELTYQELLKRNLDLYTNTITISPNQIVEQMSVTVRIEGPTPITRLEVSERQAPGTRGKRIPLSVIHEVSPHRKDVTWAPTADQQRDLGSLGARGQFVVSYDVDHVLVPQNFVYQDKYFVHRLSPTNLPQLVKHIVFVLDYSASMKGQKMDQLKIAMGKILSDLTPKDFFSIVLFNTNCEIWSPNGVIAPDLLNARVQKSNFDFVVESLPANTALAQKFIQDSYGNHSTNIMGGLMLGLNTANLARKLWSNQRGAPQPTIVFLTDGKPNIDVNNTDTIVNIVTGHNTLKFPIYSLAFGGEADYKFLHRLSYSNNGFAQKIYEGSDASIQLIDFYKRISSPLLTNITFQYLPDQVNIEATTTTNFPVFNNGSELVVCGKLKRTIQPGAAIGVVNANSANGVQRYPTTAHPMNGNHRRYGRAVPEEHGGEVEDMWAHLMIQQLLEKADTLTDTVEQEKTREEATNLSLEHSLVTPVTCLFVAKSDQEEIVAETFSVQAGNWSYSDDNVEQPSIIKTFQLPVDMTNSPPVSTENLLPVSTSNSPPVSTDIKGQAGHNKTSVPPTKDNSSSATSVILDVRCTIFITMLFFMAKNFGY